MALWMEIFWRKGRSRNHIRNDIPVPASRKQQHCGIIGKNTPHHEIFNAIFNATKSEVVTHHNASEGIIMHDQQVTIK